MRGLKNRKIFLELFIIGLFAIFYFLFSGSSADAANLYFSPSSGSYQVGSKFSVKVLLDSQDVAINAVATEINFPTDKIEVVSISKNNPIFGFWITEPIFSNQLGKISIEGVILNPGFKGLNGKIIDIEFKIKKIGEIKLSFTEASILANDGKATNILEKLGEARFNLNENVASESTTSSQTIGTPLAPKIVSLSHPDPNKWYLNKNAKFAWSISNGINGLRFSYDKYSASTLTNINAQPSPIYSTEINNLADGVWYFHLQFKNNNGWGAISHFRFQIDSQSPAAFSIRKASEEECPDNPQPSFIFSTTDSLSGIDYYLIKIDGGEPKIVSRDAIKNDYIVDKQRGGNHVILVEAYDKAGNSRFASTDFCVKALPAPVFLNYPTQVEPGGVVIIEGKTVSSSIVRVWLQKSGGDIKEDIVRSSREGNFSYIVDEKLSDGIYRVWAEATDLRGAVSDLSDKINFVVNVPAPLKVGRVIIDYMAILIVLISLIVLLIFIIYYFSKRFSSWKKRVDSDTQDTEKTLHEAFTLLKEETEKQVSQLDGQDGLNPREKEINENLKRVLSVSEKMVNKEIDDIKKDVK